jgi:hypothetical protein
MLYSIHKVFYFLEILPAGFDFKPARGIEPIGRDILQKFRNPFGTDPACESPGNVVVLV